MASRSSSVKPLTISTPPRATAVLSVAAARRSSAPVRLPRTTSATGSASASRLPWRISTRPAGIALSATFAAAESSASRSSSRPIACAAPSRAAAIASTPDPVPTSTTERPASGVRCSAARHSRVDSWWPVPKPIDGSITMVQRIEGLDGGVAGEGGGAVQVPRRRDDDAPDADRRQRRLRALGPRFVVDVDRRRRRAGPCRCGGEGVRGDRPRLVAGEEDAPGERVVAGRVELGDRGGGEVVEPGREQPGPIGLRLTAGDAAPASGPTGPDADVQRRPALHPKMSLTRSKNGFSPESRSVCWTSAGSTRRSSSIALRCSLESFLGTLGDDRHEQVAVPAAGDVGQALVPDLQHGAARRAVRDVQRVLAVERRHLHRSAEGERRERHAQLAVEVVVVALEERVVGDDDDDVEIAGRPALDAVLAFAGQAQALAGGDAGRDLHLEVALLGRAAVAAARLARLGDDAAGAAAVAARLGDGEEALLVADLADAAALRTRLRPGPARRARALARRAGLLARDADLRLGALGRGLEGDLEVVAQIGAAARAGAAAAEGVAETEDVAEPAEDVAEVGEHRRVEALAAALVHAGVAEAIVGGALVAVGEDRVGLGRFLELLLGRVVARVAIGVVLERQLAVGALDLPVRGRARDAQDLVVVALSHATPPSPSPAGAAARRAGSRGAAPR